MYFQFVRSIFLLSLFLFSFCSLKTYNPSDPTTREYIEHKWLQSFFITVDNQPASTESQSTLVPVMANSLVSGGNHVCVLLTNAKVRCWGRNNFGQLGLGNVNSIGDNEFPSTVVDVDVGGDVQQIAAGEEHTCVLLTNGKVRCWGKGSNGQLGYGNLNSIGDDETPASAGDVPLPMTATQVTVGSNFSCALLINSTVRCWGGNSSGELGSGIAGTVNNASLSNVVNTGGVAVASLSSGWYGSCVVLVNSNVYCWGSNNFGQLGYANTTDVGATNTPFSVGTVSFGLSISKISIGLYHACVIGTLQQLQCWGYGADGRLGYPGSLVNVGDDETPAGLTDLVLGGNVRQVSITHHTCALLVDDTLRCWGLGTNGKLGYGNVIQIGDDETPASAGAVPVGFSVKEVSLGYGHSCALAATGRVRCWGANGYGQLGYGHTTDIGTSAGQMPPLDVSYR
ncbi:RCC1 domain-containing protein [Leptospira stimsonii]|uniref:RCC1-like domain-containing protein n=1 Tax=Leptospira stimsonii TaxID=2202203 RepID=A0A396Z1U5_9LEPT|nr:RCC1 domain-containing protein [Leptospira stimsonii]RHX87140.1 hypothetical protein DLM75_16625 [Leptospira stimsonii]